MTASGPAPATSGQRETAHYELMPRIDNRQPPGESRIVGWAVACLRCGDTAENPTAEDAGTWMARHDDERHGGAR